MQKDTFSSQMHAELCPGYITSWITIKPQKIWIKSNCIKHPFWPQNYEIRNQLLGKKYKTHKYVETIQYVTKRPMDQWKNQRGNKKK